VTIQANTEGRVKVVAIDNAAYRAINRTDTLGASGHLRRLRDLELLEMKGGGSRTYYVPGQRFLAAPVVSATEKVLDEPNSHQLTRDSHQSKQNSHQDLVTVPLELAERIPPVGTKPRREIMSALIVDLCRWRALSARELATILNGRGHKPLVRDYLTPMVEEGLLAYTIAAMENHPDQRYTVPAARPESGDLKA
jgi:ATP-dependent DNA helicase RecG